MIRNYLKLGKDQHHSNIEKQLSKKRNKEIKYKKN